MLYDAEIMLAFIEEIEEYLPQLRKHLNTLAGNPKNKEALEEAYRLAHTIKGSAAMLELDGLSNEGKVLEQTLLPVVEKKTAFTPALAQTLLGRVSIVEDLLSAVKQEASGEAPTQAPVPEPAVASALPPAPVPEPPLEPAFSPTDFPPPPPPPASMYGQTPASSTHMPKSPFGDEAFGLDMPPIGFNQSMVPPPPPPPPSAHLEPPASIPMPPPVEMPPLTASLPDWLETASPAFPPPPMPPMSDFSKAAPAFPAWEPPADFDFRLEGVAEPVFDVPPPPPPLPAWRSNLPTAPMPQLPPFQDKAAQADTDLDFLLDSTELHSLESALFALDEELTAPSNPALAQSAMPGPAFAPLNPPAKPTTPSIPPARTSADFDPQLDDILATNQVDDVISQLQSEILSELPVQVAEFNSVPLPAEISVSDAELLMSLGADTTNTNLAQLHGLDHGNSVENYNNSTLPMPVAFPPLDFGKEHPADLDDHALNDFTAAADLLAEFDPENQLNFDLAPHEQADLESLEPLAPFDDVPTVKAQPFKTLPVEHVEAAQPVAESPVTKLPVAESPVTQPSVLEEIPTAPTAAIPFSSVTNEAVEFPYEEISETLAAGQEDYEAATLAAFDNFRGLPSLTATPTTETEETITDPELDAAVAALEQDAASLPDSLTDEEMAEAGFGTDDTEMGAFFLAEGQADIDRLKGLVADFNGSDDKLVSAQIIGDICGTLRKAATMMDLEAVGRQLEVMENTAGLVTSGELPAESYSGQLLETALAQLLVLLAPFEEAAANLFALPDEAPVPSTEEAPLVKSEEAATLAPAPRAPAPVVITPSSDFDTEMAEVFASEAEEHIQTLDTRLAALEREPHNRELLREIRRTAHTLKGSAAMVGFQVISQTGHLMEDLLDRLYDGTMEVTEPVVELLFLTFNAIDTMVRDLSASKPENPQLLETLRPRYAAILGGEEFEDSEEAATGAIIFAPKTDDASSHSNQPALPAVRLVEEADVAAMEAAIEAADITENAEAEPAPTQAPVARPTAQPAALDVELAVRVSIRRLDIMMNEIGELVINRTVIERRNQILTRTVDELTLSINRLQRVTRELETRYEVELLKNEAVPVAVGAGAGSTSTLDYPLDDRPRYGGNGPSLPDRNEEFDTLEMDRYTEFHTLSREMTETVDDLAAALRELDHIKGDLDTAILQQSRLTDDLQDRVVKVRLVPVSNLTPRLYRTVRSLAGLQQKDVEFVVSGEHTQLDKTIFEELGDPLLHLVRNAIDHGIETPDEREQAGKPRTATLTFAARNEGSQVVIEVSEDGRGIELDRVRQIGIERGLITADATLADEELYDLIFVPGFSTSETITDISGRGVGLDVVRANITRLKGTVEVSSKPGQGTTFILRLPSTLAITRALLVRVSGYTYAIPLNAIERTVRTEPDAIEEYGNRTYYRVEDSMLPLLDLGGLLQLHPHQRRPLDDEEEANRSQFSIRRERPLLVINGPERAILRVDNLIGQQEVVVKALGTHLKNVPGVTGATILGTGEVILILNPYELVSAAVGRRSRSARLPQVVSQVTRRGGTDMLQQPGPRKRAPLIQVVDDSLSIRKVLSAALEKAGFRVRTSKDGQEALDMVQQVPPDLIVMDIEMPRMDGYELTSLLKSRESYRRIPIVMLTSRAGLKHRQKAEEVGADGFLIKPYREQELLQIVSALLVRSR